MSRLDHRWKEARKYAHRGSHLFRGRIDPLVRGLADILKSRGTSTSRRNSRNFQHNIDLVRALAIFEERSVHRSKIEAYLLTTLTFAEIAERVQESANVIELFAQCFFDVRQGFSDQQMREVVVAMQVADPLHEQDSYWKQVALSGGADALDFMLAPRDVNSVQDAAVRAAIDAKAIAVHKITEAVRQIDLCDAATLRELRKLWTELTAAHSDDSQSSLLEGIDNLLESFRFWAGGFDREGNRIAKQEFLESAVELNLDETMADGLGRELVHRKELLELRFPENDDDVLPSAKRFQVGQESPDDSQSANLSPIPTATVPKAPPSWEALQHWRKRQGAAVSAVPEANVDEADSA